MAFFSAVESTRVSANSAKDPTAAGFSLRDQMRLLALNHFDDDDDEEANDESLRNFFPSLPLPSFERNFSKNEAKKLRMPMQRKTADRGVPPLNRRNSDANSVGSFDFRLLGREFIEFDFKCLENVLKF